ncbi:MAG: FtsQ-type POTRA domain-containing protein [Verrucomicrobiota bacterium]
MQRKPNRSKTLHLRVTSPRILWIGFLRGMLRLSKLAVLAALAVALGWGVLLGIRQALYKNPDFELVMIDLNENPVVDAIGFAKMTGINLADRPTIFEINVRRAEETLEKLPGVQSAEVTRDLPGTLVVRIVPRMPKAWLHWPAAGFETIRETGGFVIDAAGVPFPVSETMLGTTMDLPVVRLAAKPEKPRATGQVVTGAEIERCFRLLDSAVRADPVAATQIDSIRQANEWSLELLTRDGTAATFSFGDHDAQIARFRSARDHAAAKGLVIATINLIPKHNVPYTLRGDAPEPVSIVAPAEAMDSRFDQDVRSLLNRN